MATLTNKWSRRRLPIKMIVIHWWGDPNLHRGGHNQGVVRFLCTSNRKSSAHAVISPYEITEIIEPDKVAWHAGVNAIRSTINQESIGIECWPWDERSDPKMVQQCLTNIATWIAHYWRLYPQLVDRKLECHKTVTNPGQTVCPGPFYQARLELLRQMASDIYHGKKKEKETPNMVIFKTETGLYYTFDGVWKRMIPTIEIISALTKAGVPVAEVTNHDMSYIPDAPVDAVNTMLYRSKVLSDILTNHEGAGERSYLGTLAK